MDWIWVLTFVAGLCGGAVIAYAALHFGLQHRFEEASQREAAGLVREMEATRALERTQEEYRQQQKANAQKTEAINKRYEQLRSDVEAHEKSSSDVRYQLQVDREQYRHLKAEAERELEFRQKEFQQRIISYDELVDENRLLKRDLQNIDVTLHKRLLDNELLQERQGSLDARSQALASRYLAETVKIVGNSMTPNNYAALKDRLLGVIERCRSIGFAISEAEEAGYVAALQAEFERVVRISIQREEQARIKAQIREEERLQREAQRAIEQAAKEREMVEAALAAALARAQGEHNEQVEQLRAQLAEAEAKTQRAVSMAQQTRAGNVYVISNRGSFGDGVFKIGMTRRLEPLDRIRELGDASVPFPFDVHMMITCEDAPTLENALHKALNHCRINKVNPRKEYFHVDIDTIVDVVRKNHGEIEYVATAEALEYTESLTMSDADADYIEQVFESAEGPKTAVVDD